MTGLPDLGLGPVTDVVRLSGGASRETFSLTAGGRAVILQQHRPGSPVAASGADLAGTVDLEADLLRAAAAAGVPVPEVVAEGETWLVTDRVPGEALPRRLLRDDEFAVARERLAFEAGAALARVHSIDPGPFHERLAADEQISRLREVLDLTSGDHPAIEAGFRHLELTPPPERPLSLVHGDFRTGNLLVGPEGLTGVLDWELAHLGNPVEDLGWFCVRAWRFGSPHRAGGFGSAEQLLDGYASVAGERIDPAELDWWELFGTLRWGVICAVQAESHLSGAVRSVELAAIGRRACENEYDALALMGAGGPVPDGPADGYGRPTAGELVEAVREFLEADVMDATEGRLRFHARVAANALAIVERELAATGGPDDPADEAALAAAIRAGAHDDRWPDLLGELWATTVARLRVANPKYLAGS